MSNSPAKPAKADASGNVESSEPTKESKKSPNKSPVSSIAAQGSSKTGASPKPKPTKFPVVIKPEDLEDSDNEPAPKPKQPKESKLSPFDFFLG